MAAAGVSTEVPLQILITRTVSGAGSGNLGSFINFCIAILQEITDEKVYLLLTHKDKSVDWKVCVLLSVLSGSPKALEAEVLVSFADEPGRPRG